MGTISEIRTDTDYHHYTVQFLLLNNQYSDQAGTSPVILLSHASLLSFIQVFEDVLQCQGYIRNNIRKLHTLFISHEKIIEWHNRINDTETNIDKVYIFCSLYSDYLAMKAWTGCYRTKIRDVYLSKDMEYHLLKLGFDHIHQILPEFPETGLKRKLCRQAQDMLRTLSNYFQDRADDNNDDESTECL